MDFKKIDIRKYVNINSMIFSEVYIGKRILGKLTDIAKRDILTRIFHVENCRAGYLFI
jgi:hypothetical protein